ncbi:MAG: hypothetical protein LBE04_05865 [Prevotellaceae bacterium]|jgi:hypothetical protein|nr:hypothetical protein [Prevotellaceae bacterium]
MTPTHNDFKILFEGKPDEYFDLYRDEIDEILAPDEDDDDTGESDDLGDADSLDAEELFEILFTIPIFVDDDYCEMINVLADEYLPYDIDADYEDDKLIVHIDENRHVIDDSEGGYSIVRQFNEIIKPDFEIRVFKLSLDDYDIHSLIILKSEVWKELETKYGAKVAAYFAKIDKIDFNDKE